MQFAHHSLGKIVLIEFCTQQDEYLGHKRDNFKVKSCHDRIKKRFSLWLKFDELSRLFRWHQIKVPIWMHPNGISSLQQLVSQLRRYYWISKRGNQYCLVNYCLSKLLWVVWRDEKFCIKGDSIRVLQKIFYDFWRE